MQPRYTLDGTTHEVGIRSRRDGRCELVIDGHRLAVVTERDEAGELWLLVDGVPRLCHVAQDANRLFVHLDGRAWELEAIDEFGQLEEEGGGPARVRAPMPGVVVDCCVAAGAEVARGAALMLIESMKLQTEIRAPVAGRVVEVAFGAGQSFAKGALLVALEAQAEPRS